MRPVAMMIVAVSLLLAGQASGENYVVQLNGTGGLMLNGADYEGDISMSMLGDWTLDVDDSLWPDASDSIARFDYIWDTFFASNYNTTTGAENWLGYFDGGTLPTPPRLTLDVTDPVEGVLVFNVSLVVLIRDWYADGILQQNEKHHNSQVSMTLSVETPLCSGYFEDYCGDGSGSSGNFNFVNPPDTDSIMFIAQLDVQYCGAPVGEERWATIKALFR